MSLSGFKINIVLVMGIPVKEITGAEADAIIAKETEAV